MSEQTSDEPTSTELKELNTNHWASHVNNALPLDDGVNDIKNGQTVAEGKLTLIYVRVCTFLVQGKSKHSQKNWLSFDVVTSSLRSRFSACFAFESGFSPMLGCCFSPFFPPFFPHSKNV